ncbi:phage head closure protein [Sphingomonas sp. VNH70]|uniref:phage head closure protein n=1 Tax=Sphingomonas silueang TaxID=3156617 RepID=UPI0032B4F6CD
MTIATSTLTHRVTVLRAGSIDDGLSSVPGGMLPIGRRWARKADISDGERIEAAQQGQTLTTRFVVRADTLTRAVTAKDMLDCRGVRYAIVGTKETRDRTPAIEITATAQKDLSA